MNQGPRTITYVLADETAIAALSCPDPEDNLLSGAFLAYAIAEGTLWACNGSGITQIGGPSPVHVFRNDVSQAINGAATNNLIDYEVSENMRIAGVWTRTAAGNYSGSRDGWIEIDANVVYDVNVPVDANARYSPVCRININGVDVAWSQEGYVRDATADTQASVRARIKTPYTAGDAIQVFIDRESGNANGVSTISGRSKIILCYI